MMTRWISIKAPHNYLCTDGRSVEIPDTIPLAQSIGTVYYYAPIFVPTGEENYWHKWFSWKQKETALLRAKNFTTGRNYGGQIRRSSPLNM